MAIHTQFSLSARKIFGKIYPTQAKKLDIFKASLDEQLSSYLIHLAGHLGKEIPKADQKKILSIIKRDNEVANILKSKAFMQITSQMKELTGLSLGLVFCIDGRIPAIFLGSRFASHWEVPAAELIVTKRKSDNQPIPESSELCEALRLVVSSGKELLEIVFAHTSLLNPAHGCGAMAAKRKLGKLANNLSNEEANLKIIETVTIPSMTNIYNELRVHHGQEPLSIVGISALYDTDTFGIVLNYDKRDQGQAFSTTQLTDKYKDTLDDYFIKQNLVFGSFRERFSHLKYLPAFSQNALKVTEEVLKNQVFEELRSEINEYIKTSYSQMTKKQQDALKVFLIRTIALQYLIGSSSLSKKTLEHPFAHHGEHYMAVSTRGTTIGKFDPQDQGFSSTPSDTKSAVLNIKTKLSIMNSSKQNSKESHPLFICNPVNKRDLKEQSVQLHKIMDANSELLRAIVEDPEIWALIKSGKVIPVPVLIEEETREILQIIDHSVYV